MNTSRQAKLKIQAQACAARILAARENVEYFQEPFKHLVLDDFFDDELVANCLDQFPPLTSSTWDEANDADIEVKYRTTWKSEFDIPDGLVDAVRILNSSLILNALSHKVGIAKIVPDPYFSGGGLNVMLRDGLLDVHVDGNYHDATGLNRRLNAIVYLTPDWEASWGGEFGVYDSTGKNCVKRVAPLFNRLVVFDSHDFSFHGLPEPLNCPLGVQRRSIILYYYTKESRPTPQVMVEEPHSALWVRRGLMDKKNQKTRDFK